MNSIAPDQRQQFTDSAGRLTTYGIKLLQSYFDRGGRYDAPTNTELNTRADELAMLIDTANTLIAQLNAQLADSAAQIATLETLIANSRPGQKPDLTPVEVMQARR